MKVLGLKELEEIMVKTLPNKVNRNVLLGAIRSSAQPMKFAAKANAFAIRRSGALSESINLKTLRNRGNNKEFASVALAPMRGNMTAWAMYKAYYTGRNPAADIQSGAISAKTARRAGITHGHLVEFGFNHVRSGRRIPARPWLRPAFDLHANGFVSTFRKNLQVRIEAAAKKIYAKNKARIKV